MAQRTAFLNSDAKGFNKDFHHTWISNYMLKQPGVMFSNYSTKPEFALGNGQISGGKAIIRCTRTTGTFAGEEILACFESTSTENISTAGNKKVYIEIPEVYVNDSTAITDSLTQGANLNVGRIVSSDSYPTHSNYIKLWEISNGDWQNATDLRPEVLRRGKPNTLSYFGGNGEEERIDIDNSSLNKYLMSNGAGVAPSWEEGGGGGGSTTVENFKRTFTADSDLLAKSMFGVVAIPTLTDVNDYMDFGRTTVNDVFFCVYLNGEDFSSLTLNLAGYNSPADSLSVRLETLDSNGKPSGTLIDVGAYGTVTLSSETLADVTINLAGTVSGLAAHTKIAVVLSRSGSYSDSNCYRLGMLNTVNRITQLYISYEGSYSSISNSGCVACDGFATEAVMQSTSSNGISPIGYSETGATAGNDFTGILQGTVDYTGVTTGTKYYLGSTGILDTTGDIQVGVGLENGVLSFNVGGGGGQNVYDAIVAADGSGDYTTINAALTAGENRIFVKNGTYNEGTQLLIKTPTVYIQGESSDGVIVNLEKSSTETTYLGYINFDSTDYTEDLIGVINNVTFNAIIGKGNQLYYFVLAETPSVHNNKNITINNCYINFLGKAASNNICISQLTETEASSTHILSLNNCILVTDAHSSVTASDVSFRFYTAQEGRPTRNIKTISNDCRFIMRKTGFNNLSVMGTNNNCSFWIDGDNSEDITYMNIHGCNTGCFFDFNGYGTRLIRGILIGCTVGNYGSWKNNATQTAAVRSWVSSGAAEREASHSYSVNDVVRYEGNIYICTEAHTSDSGGLDYNKFRVYMGYTYITRRARITNSFIGLGGDTIIEDEHDANPRDSTDIGFVSNNEITVNAMSAGVPHIIVLGEERIIGNVITSTLYTIEIRLYVIDNCMVNSNSFNIGVDGVVKGVGSNSLILGNIINTYTGTATCTVEAGKNNIADNNIISTKRFQ